MNIILENFDQNYLFIYFIMAVAAIFISLQQDLKKEIYPKMNSRFILGFSIAFTLLFGLRDLSIGSDTLTYAYTFEQVQYNSNFKEIGYYLFNLFLSQFTNVYGLFLVLAGIYVIGLGIYCMNLKNSNTYLIFFTFVSFFFFKSMGINILRQGVSLMFFLHFMQNFNNKNYKISYLFVILALAFHLTTVIPIIVFFSSHIFKRPNYPIILFFLSLILSYLGFGINFLTQYMPFVEKTVNDERLTSYIGNDSTQYIIGFRPGFVLFNTIFLGIFLIIRNKFFTNLPAGIKSEYSNGITIYCILSSIFFLCFQIPYSDRIGLISWIFIPTLLVPLFNVKSFKRTAFISVALCICIFLIFNVFTVN